MKERDSMHFPPLLLRSSEYRRFFREEEGRTVSIVGSRFPLRLSGFAKRLRWFWELVCGVCEEEEWKNLSYAFGREREMMIGGRE